VRAWLGVALIGVVGACGRTPVYGSGLGDGGGSGGGSGIGPEHGVIVLELQTRDSETGNPFVGTATVLVTLVYQSCLADFYADNPSWAEIGADGDPVFAAAAGPNGLCDDDDLVAADCTVGDIFQDLGTAPSLTVDYDIAGDLEDRRLTFGPLPTRDLAQCPGDTDPIVRVARNAAVQGFDAEGTQLWKVRSFAPGQAFTGQVPPITFRVSRL
jgi:hypothetical protein